MGCKISCHGFKIRWIMGMQLYYCDQESEVLWISPGKNIIMDKVVRSVDMSNHNIIPLYSLLV